MRACATILDKIYATYNTFQETKIAELVESFPEENDVMVVDESQTVE